jgi:signal transduction histidine kinase
VVSNIRAELSAQRNEPDAADRIAALVEWWASAIPLRSSFGAGVWDRLREPGRAEAVVDAISEGLANAVRHGDGSDVTLEVLPAADDGVSVLVVSGGVLSTATPGIGLLQLAERGDVALREVGGRVELAVAIP